jgi:hypothetical protein
VIPKNAPIAKYVCRWQRRNYLVLGLAVAAVLAAQLVWFVVKKQPGDDIGVAVAGDAIGIFFGLCFAAGSFRAAEIVISEDEVIYKSYLRRQRIPKNEIEEASSDLRLRGVVTMRQPFLRLTNGRTVRLAEFSAYLGNNGSGVTLARNGLLRESQAGKNEAMIADLNRWRIS